MPTLKLYYWNMPGYAEVTRLLLTGGNIPFENVYLTPETWPEFKPKTPFGQVPVLEVDGKLLAQSHAIDVYCAKLAGFYPEDPMGAARADEVAAFLRDMWAPFVPTWDVEDEAERLKVREALLPKFREQLTALQKYLEGKEFVSGSKLSFGDLQVYVDLSMYRSGMMPGMPTTILDDYPGLRAFRSKIARVDFIEKYYDSPDVCSMLRSAFDPDSE